MSLVYLTNSSTPVANQTIRPEKDVFREIMICIYKKNVNRLIEITQESPTLLKGRNIFGIFTKALVLNYEEEVFKLFCKYIPLSVLVENLILIDSLDSLKVHHANCEVSEDDLKVAIGSATIFGRLDIIEFFMLNYDYVNVDSKFRFFVESLSIALELKHEAISEVLYSELVVEGAIMVAATCGYLNVLEFFASKGDNPLVCFKNGETTLSIASKNGNPEIVEFLLGLEYSDQSKFALISKALEVVGQAVYPPVDSSLFPQQILTLDTPQEAEKKPMDASLPLSPRLLPSQSNSEPDSPVGSEKTRPISRVRQTPATKSLKNRKTSYARLKRTINANNFTLVQFLLGEIYKNDEHDKDFSKAVLFHAAVKQDHVVTVKQLIAIGVNVNTLPNKRHCHALLTAIKNENIEIATLIIGSLDAKSINVTNRNGDTALHLLAKKGMYADVVKSLLKKGADFELLNSKKQSPLDCSTNKEISRLLKGKRSAESSPEKPNKKRQRTE